MSLAYFAWPSANTAMRGPQGRQYQYPPTTHKEFMKAKALGYAASFNRDPAVYEAVQQVAFGVPQVTAAAS